MPAGSVTDDTEQAVLVAELLIAGAGRLDPARFAAALVEWETQMQARGSLDLLGPSTKAAVERIRAGVPVTEAESTGTTNGAAMRITPVGIATAWRSSPDAVETFVDTVQDACRITHNTGTGIAGAAAVAAAVSAALGGADTAGALDAAVEAARVGSRRGTWVAGADVSRKLDWARGYLPQVRADRRVEVLTDVIGTSVASQESVVAALALVALDEDPWQTLCLAASAGGDTDTVAAMAGAILGAVHGTRAWPQDAVLTLQERNALDFGGLVDGLLALRR